MDVIYPFLPQIQLLAQVALAMLLGALIGLERELASKPAGLRTHMLITGAATAFVELGNVLIQLFSQAYAEPLIQADPIRMIEAIVSGIGFLGAGMILRDRAEGSVEGLTTAASLLFCASIGIAVGLRLWVFAPGMTILVLLILRGMNLFRRGYRRVRN